MNAEIVFIQSKKDSGLATEDERKRLKEVKLKVVGLEKELKIKENAQQRQQMKREHDKTTLDNNPDIRVTLKERVKVGRPRIEDDQPGFLKAIVDIATHGGLADSRRQSEMLRTVRTLDGLTEELQQMGYETSTCTRK